MMVQYEEIAGMIDHAVLHPTQTFADLKSSCELVKTYGVISICVKPYAVADTRALLAGSEVKTGCVVGFPAGNSAIEVKVFEAHQACRDGAQEVDFVINIGKALEGDWDYLRDEVNRMTAVCHQYGAVVKVIFETDFVQLDEDLKILCRIATEAGADYVKTSTGFGFVKGKGGVYFYRGALISHIRTMCDSVGKGVGVKASGGIRSLGDLLKFKDEGCLRIGTSSTKAILDEFKTLYGNS